MKRIIYVLIAIIMVVTCLSGCGSNEKEVGENKNIISSNTENVFLYTTQDKNDYMNYLNTLDTSVYEVLGITTSITEPYRAQEFYMITYRKIDAPKSESKGNDYDITTLNGYYVFTTKDSELYLDFIDEMDFSKYKILGITTSITEPFRAQEFYMITYCEQ